MTRIVLEVSQEKDLDLLLALLERLDVRVIEKNDEGISKGTSIEEQDFILQGLPLREDFEDFVRDFEKSREDRPLPGRQ